MTGEVLFRNVSFAYNEDRTILSNIDLQVRPGETLAIVGPSGSGKTTLISLLQRFYDPTSASIRLDGVDLRFLQWRPTPTSSSASSPAITTLWSANGGPHFRR